jgi:hypothetical protein
MCNCDYCTEPAREVQPGIMLCALCAEYVRKAVWQHMTRPHAGRVSA